jgi:hypothetical protein
MQKLPPLLYITDEGRRVYEFHAIINQRKIEEIHIDPHYEQEHSSYMTDEMIYNFALELECTSDFDLEGRTKDWEYYSYITWMDWRTYEMSLCLKDGANFLGVRSCYRRSKYDKDHDK